MANPSISIVLATKNGSRTIEHAIKSVQAQKDVTWELIIVNDGSTDKTSDIIDTIAHGDKRIKILTNETNVGPGASRNTAIQNALGIYIAFIDDDDEWTMDEKLSLQKIYLDKYTETVIVGSATTNFISETGSLLKKIHQPYTDEQIRNKMLLRNPFITSSVVIRKQAYLDAGGFRDMYLAEDYDLWMRMGKIGTLANLDRCDINYMVHAKSASASRSREMSRIVLSLIKTYRRDYPNAFLALIKGYARVLLFDFKHLF